MKKSNNRLYLEDRIRQKRNLPEFTQDETWKKNTEENGYPGQTDEVSAVLITF